MSCCSPVTKIVVLHPHLLIMTTSPQQPLFSVPTVAVVGRFDCIKSYLQNDMLGKLIGKIYYKNHNIMENCQWFYSEIKIQRSNLYDTGIQILHAYMYD